MHHTPRDPEIALTIEMSASTAEVCVRDSGVGFAVPNHDDCDSVDVFESGMNRGITLMRTLTTEARFNEQGNEVTLVTYQPL